MKNLKCELVRIHTSDRLELQGLLFEPREKASIAVVHVHGWTGNFYENKFLDFMAEGYTSAGLAFLSFNTRGAGHVQEFIREKNSKSDCVKIGGSLEKFEDCLFDLKAAIEFLKERGFEFVVLQGHSTGCQKVAFYQNKTKDKKVKGLVLIEPTDDPSISKRFLGSRFEEAMDIARENVKRGSENQPMPDWMPFGVQLSSQKFLSMSNSKSEEGKIFDYSGELSEIKQIDCPVLAVFGDKTEYQEKPGEKLELLKTTMKDCKTNLFNNTNHWFVNKEKELTEAIVQWIKSTSLPV